MTDVRSALPLVLSVFVAGVLLSASATDMEKKRRTWLTVDSRHAGKVEITCNDPGSWRADVSVSDDRGRDVVTVRLSSPTNAVPPQFGVYFRVPGNGVQNVWTSDFSENGFHLWPKLWWGNGRYSSALAWETPIAVGFNSTGVSPIGMACSEALERLRFCLYADDETCDIIGRYEFFTELAVPRRTYVAKVLVDRRGGQWYDAVREASEWVVTENGFKPADVPEAAFDPLYSTWYAYLQNVHAPDLEREARLAASVGMKTMILDDGWQKDDSADFYSATGDWMPVKSRFLDFKAHVDAVHRAGLKYMVWLAVPFVGRESAACERFKGKFLREGVRDVNKLDPRFPEVREYLITTYERVVRDWGFDGVKLDFIDQFRFGDEDVDPAEKENYAGRDYKSLPEAVDRLMRDVYARLHAINPDVLVEFRQHYMGPAILQYGNMMRAADCPADPCANRRRTCDLRLTSGKAAVHSDMLVWGAGETPESAALPILNVLFSTIQYSMILAKLPESHYGVIRHWLAFSQAHRETLLKGAFRPHHPENGYTWIEAESAAERIVAAYSAETCVPSGAPDRTLLLVNATGSAGMLAELAAAPKSVEFFDVVGRPAGNASPGAGLCRLAIPASGYARITW